MLWLTQNTRTPVQHTGRVAVGSVAERSGSAALCPAQPLQGPGIHLSAPPWKFWFQSSVLRKHPEITNNLFYIIHIQPLPQTSHERGSPKDGNFKKIPNHDSEEQGFVQAYPYSLRPGNVFCSYSDQRATHRLTE